MGRKKLDKGRIWIRLSDEFIAHLESERPKALDLSAWAELLMQHGLRWWKAAGSILPPDTSKPPKKRGSPAPPTRPKR